MLRHLTSIARRQAAAALLLVSCLAAFTPSACADVAALTNRTNVSIRVTTIPPGQNVPDVQLEPGESRPVFFDVATRLTARHGKQVEEFEVRGGQAYYFGMREAIRRGEEPTLQLQEIGLGASPAPRVREEPVLPPLGTAGVITVKLLVDDDERTRRQVWEPLIRKRLDAASKVFEQHCKLRLKVVAIETWDSAPVHRSFDRTLKEFENEVNPAPAQVAIGFTSQYRIQKGRYHLGGTRGPLHPHILLKERAVNVQEPERLELLIHELGHFLGASHSPEPNSVMRPLLTGGQQRVKGASIKFDPVNTLLMAMLGEEIRRKRVLTISDVSLRTRKRMDAIYAALEPAIPDDPAANIYRRIVRSAGAKPLVKDVRRILDHLVRVGQLQQRFAGEGKPALLEGDALLELYVRQAAHAALRVQQETAPQAFLLALGILLDDTDLLAQMPVSNLLIDRVENPKQRKQRLAARGKPTMHERADLAKHFCVSAYVVTLSGSKTARSAGLAKELLDSQGGTGFSFADMAANRAGIVFANAVVSKALPLERVAKEFSVEKFLPPVDDLTEGIAAEDFLENYGGVGDPRFNAEMARIERQITKLIAAALAEPSTGSTP